MENTMIQKTDPTVAKTILAQINASDYWARARWGYNSPVYSNDSLSFKVNGAKVGHAWVKVTLTPSDAYTVEVYKFRKVKWDFKKTEFAKIEDVYFDSLVRVITSAIDGN